MADWFIATEGVKVVKDSASLWPQIFTAGAAFGGVCSVQARLRLQSIAQMNIALQQSIKNNGQSGGNQ